MLEGFHFIFGTSSKILSSFQEQQHFFQSKLVLLFSTRNFVDHRVIVYVEKISHEQD